LSERQASQAASDAAFTAAVSFVIDTLEGGGVRTVDRGGVTRYGIAQRFHPGVDVEHLTRDEAVAIYRAEYWTPMRCDDLPPAVAFLAFDMAVNPGPSRAVAMLQAELRVEPDGVIGPDTLDAARRAARTELLVGLTARRLEHYRQVVLRHPPEVVNLNGWFRRAGRALVYASRLA
jgi:lysozyme family protein